MKFRVESNGRLHGTRVLTRGGVDISQSVSGLAFRANADTEPMLTLTLAPGAVEIDAEASLQMEDPVSGRLKTIKRIEWSDGTVFDATARG